MKHLIKHLFANNLDEILSKSLLNCHCKGLHSIMLSESPEKTIRLYVAVEGNEMHKNFPENFTKGDMTIAFHPHHCNLTLHCIKGKFLNWELEEKERGIRLTKFKYQSKIKEGEMAFQPLGESFLRTSKFRWMQEGDCVQMKANEIHTVACHTETLTAWLVYEGKEDPDYKSFCWSNSDINNMNSEGLYVKPTKEDVENLLVQSGLLD